MGGFALVNGDPNLVTDSIAFPMVTSSSNYRQYLLSHPSSMLTVYGERFLDSARMADGTQRIEFANAIADCEACSPTAAAEFAFDFDDDGTFLGVRPLDILATSAIDGGEAPPGN